MYIALDDTDSTHWMCTTYLATVLIEESGLDLIGLPRLVRLNPSVPWKTRGNGAICLRLGKGGGRAEVVGEIEGREVPSFEYCLSEPSAPDLLELGEGIIRRWARISEGASPGVVVSKRKPSQSIYWRGVRDILDRSEVIDHLVDIGGRFGGLAGARGVLGAAAAMSWRPRDRTYEILTYRQPSVWGSDREICEESVISLDRLFPTTFNNFSSEEGRMAVTPNSPCPVLFGIRGDDPSELLEAKDTVRSETVDRWLLFLTNQGTDDHILTTRERLPNRSYAITGEVLTVPRTIPGGHVILSMDDGGEELECAAYEPSKGFRERVKQLRPGDRIRLMGELRESPRTLNIEKMEVTHLSKSMVKISNPRCPVCGRGMKSVGQGDGFRCRRCGTKASEGDAYWRVEERSIREGWYEPPVCARRHLSKPLKRMKDGNIA